MWYRIPFFKSISKSYDVKFIFTRMDIRKSTYGARLPDAKELDGIKYASIDNHTNTAIGLIKQLAINKYDIIIDSFVFIEGIIPFIFAKLKRKSIIFWTEDWGWVRQSTLKRRFIVQLENLILNKSDALLVPGSRHKDYFMSRNIPAEKIFIMPNVSNISFFNDDLSNKQDFALRKLPNERIILYVGRLDKRKGLSYLLEAFSKLKKEHSHVKLVIIGKGDYQNELENLAKKLDCHRDVQFVGYVDDKYLPLYYDICDIFVVPSINYGMADPWVLTVNEAMFFGKPVIVTDAVGAAFDMITSGENGFIVPEKNSDALGDAIKKLLLNPDLQIRMGNESKHIINEKFRYINMINGFKNAIDYVNR